MLRVFHFILDHRVGGPHVYAQTVARALESQVQSTLVTTGKGAATELALTNLRHGFRALYPIEIVWNVLWLCWHFRGKAVRNACIFDIHGAANIAPLLAARLLGIPVVWHFHETLGSYERLARLGRSVLAGGRHKIVVVANKAAQVFKLPDSELIPGAIDINYWQKTAASQRGREDDRTLRMVTVGNINPLKGGDLLLDAIGELRRPWELVVVGAELSTYRDYAAKLYERAKVLARSGGTVLFVGWQSPGEVRDLLSSADIFVLPSRSEACPIALLEAMAMESVCIATDVGDVAEIIDDPRMGFVVPSGDAKSLLAVLDQVAKMSPVARLTMGERAREKIVRKYSQDKMADRHLEIYRLLAREQVGG